MYMKLSIKTFISVYTKVIIITVICATVALEDTYHTHGTLSAPCTFCLSVLCHFLEVELPVKIYTIASYIRLSNCTGNSNL